MDHPLIDTLDLRPPQPAKDDGWGWVGDFPPFPKRLQQFIDTGKMPSHWSRKVEFVLRGDVFEFNKSMERINHALATAPRNIPLTIIDSLGGYYQRPRRTWHLPADWPLLLLALIAAILIGVIVGSYPWR